MDKELINQIKKFMKVNGLMINIMVMELIQIKVQENTQEIG